MIKRAKPEDLADLAEVATIIGLSNQRGVSVYRNRHADFPQPFIEKGRCVLWVRDDVHAWALRRRAGERT
jgi:predicted DNA-binding transcriptional regulator AlpA